MALSTLGYYYLITLCIVGKKCIDISSLEDITETTCTENCENVTEIPTLEIYTQNVGITKTSLNDKNDYEDETTDNIKIFTVKPQKNLIPIVPRKSNNTETNIPIEKRPVIKIEKTKSEICECDFQVKRQTIFIFELF